MEGNGDNSRAKADSDGLGIPPSRVEYGEESNLGRLAFFDNRRRRE